MKKHNSKIIAVEHVERRNGAYWYTAFTESRAIEYGPFADTVSADAHHEESRRTAFENGWRG
ncbi:hypothetical protein EDF74_2838 [Stenotrophomonas rhizophila]|nr:hypothetical protein EDF74_2838 [Stenotrophomonas rhizophila]